MIIQIGSGKCSCSLGLCKGLRIAIGAAQRSDPDIPHQILIRRRNGVQQRKGVVTSAIARQSLSQCESDGVVSGGSKAGDPGKSQCSRRAVVAKQVIGDPCNQQCCPDICRVNRAGKRLSSLDNATRGPDRLILANQKLERLGPFLQGHEAGCCCQPENQAAPIWPELRLCNP